MVFINTEGKFNENTYLVDGNLFGNNGNLAIYIIESNGVRMMIDTSEEVMARSIVSKLKQFGIYPIHKIFLTHSHFDHVQGVNELKRIINKTKIEVIASENAIDNLKNPEKMNSLFIEKVKPIEVDTALKEGDNIDLNGLKLKVIEFYGHTMDSIALFDEKNKNIFVGDAIIDKSSIYYFQPVFMPPDFHETELLKTFQKLKEMRHELNSISLAHYGVWTGEDFENILNEMEQLHFKTKNSFINWYKENLSIKDMAIKYHEKFIPKSKIIKKGYISVLEMQITWLLEGLKRSGFI